jgi:Zn-dependent protease with chaperone function
MLTIAFVLLVLATFITLTALVCHAVVPSLLRALGPVRPDFRAHLLLLIAAAPWLIGASVLASSLADILVGACNVSTSCLWNEDPTTIEPLRALVIVPLLVAIGVMAVRIVRRQIKARGILKMLDKTSVGTDDPGVRIVPSDFALAFAGNGTIYLSNSLDVTLSAEQNRAVLLHEQAHLQRCDGRLHTVASLLSAAYVPPLRKRILDALSLANEQSCDQCAADIVGATTVASAILAVERLRGPAVTCMRLGFADCFVTARVHWLLNAKRPIWNVGRIRTYIALGIISAFMVSDILYYVTMLILYPSGKQQ